MSNIEKMMENILPITKVIGSGLICFSSLMLILSLILSLKKKTRKIFLETAGLSVFCGITIFIVPMIGKLMYMEPRVGEELVPWKDMLLLVIGILILVIISDINYKWLSILLTFLFVLFLHCSTYCSIFFLSQFCMHEL